MEGLEATEILKSELLRDNAAFRLDSDFNRKIYRRTVEVLRQRGAEQFESSEPVIIHPTEIIRDYVEENGVWFFRAQNVRPLQVDSANKVYVSRQDAALLPQNRLKAKDVLITRTGANRGDCAYFSEETEAVASSHTFIVRSQRWNQAFLTAFFNSRYGRLQIDKGVYGAAQPEVAPYYLRKIWIPTLSEGFQQAIERCFVSSAAHRRQSLHEMAKAETLLLRELGLENWQPPEPLAYQSNFSQAWNDERLDAEHFHPRFEAAEEALLQAGAIDFVGMDDLLLGLGNGQTPLYHDLSIGQVPFLCAEHVTDFQVHFDSDKRVTEGQHNTQLARTQLANDDLLITIKGRVGNTAIVENLPGPVNINQDVALLKLNRNLPLWYVVTFLNSKFGKLAVSRNSTGQINPFLALGNLRRIRVPQFEETLMNRIGDETRDLVHKANAARQQAKRLLETAKRAVEVAIEGGEEAALNLLAEVDVNSGGAD